MDKWWRNASPRLQGPSLMLPLASSAKACQESCGPRPEFVRPLVPTRKIQVLDVQVLRPQGPEIVSKFLFGIPLVLTASPDQNPRRARPLPVPELGRYVAAERDD